MPCLICSMLLQTLTLGREMAEVYAKAITLLRNVERSPVDPTTLEGLDAEQLYLLSSVSTLRLRTGRLQ